MSDLTTAARVLLCAPAPVRRRLAEQLLQEADFADRYARRLGRVHVQWGDGTLMAAARHRAMADEPPCCNDSYGSCLQIVLEALALRRAAGRRNRGRQA